MSQHWVKPDLKDIYPPDAMHMEIIDSFLPLIETEIRSLLGRLDPMSQAFNFIYSGPRRFNKSFDLPKNEKRYCGQRWAALSQTRT